MRHLHAQGGAVWRRQSEAACAFAPAFEQAGLLPRVPRQPERPGALLVAYLAIAGQVTVPIIPQVSIFTPVES